MSADHIPRRRTQGGRSFDQRYRSSLHKAMKNMSRRQGWHPESEAADMLRKLKPTHDGPVITSLKRAWRKLKRTFK